MARVWLYIGLYGIIIIIQPEMLNKQKNFKTKFILSKMGIDSDAK